MDAPVLPNPIHPEQIKQTNDDLVEIITGLSQTNKMISPKYFYDQAGSQLFDEICELPEYYPTRTELNIMETHIDEIVDLVGPRASLIEFGSGSSLKTRILLEHLDSPAVYVPVDISREHLFESSRVLEKNFPDLEILPVAADFTQTFPLPNPTIMPLRNLVYFPGSTIGNFTPDQAHQLLKVMHQEAGVDGALLIGVDLKKDKVILERAYNDSKGVTARFNLNVLKRLNREFGANFDLSAFQHKAIYDEAYGRIEMHLISTKAQTFTMGGKLFSMNSGESIVTEHSHKYSLTEFSEMAEKAGFVVDQVWTDPDSLFSVQYCLRQ
jgi:L-histidine N-alpha-methyltransferase